MKSAIEQLFYGKFAQIENIKPSQEQSNTISECDKKLRGLLKDNPEAMDTYEKFRDALDKSDCDEILAFYKEGFRNGFQIALDGMDED